MRRAAAELPAPQGPMQPRRRPASIFPSPCWQPISARLHARKRSRSMPAAAARVRGEMRRARRRASKGDTFANLDHRRAPSAWPPTGSAEALICGESVSEAILARQSARSERRALARYGPGRAGSHAAWDTKSQLPPCLSNMSDSNRGPLPPPPPFILAAAMSMPVAHATSPRT